MSETFPHKNTNQRTRLSYRVLGLFAFLLVLITTPFLSASAHHSRAMFQIDESIELEGTIANVLWKNPHVFLVIDAVNAEGGTDRWTLESHSVSGLLGNGWQQDSLQTGDHVRIVANPSNDESKLFGLLDYVILDDGKLFYSFRAPEGVNAIAPEVQDNRAQVASSDFSGTWTRMSTASPEEALRAALVGGGFDAPTGLPLTETGREQVTRFDLRDDPYLDCVPLPVPRIITWPYSQRWSWNDNDLYMEKEMSPQVRTIHFDQATAPQGYIPNELGYSFGRIAEDGTLTVETSGFAQTPWGTTRGLDSSAQKHVTEVYKLENDGFEVSFTYTLTDPVYLTEPLIETGRFRKIIDHEFTSELCDIDAANRHLEFE